MDRILAHQEKGSGKRKNIKDSTAIKEFQDFDAENSIWWRLVISRRYKKSYRFIEQTTTYKPVIPAENIVLR